MTPAALWYFESVDLFNVLCPDRANATGKQEFRKYKKGEFIYLPDEDSTHIYLIADGRVKIGRYDNEGNEIVSSILTRGEIFGELGLAGEDKRKDFATAIVDTLIYPVTIKETQERMYQDRALLSKILRFIGCRLMKVERKLELLACKDARARLIEFLKDAAAWKGKKIGFETAIFTRLTHKEIAALTGMSRQTVTTLLNQLKEQNAINFDRRKILIRDLAALK
jgi:CRP-like cAMP-binding protein